MGVKIQVVVDIIQSMQPPFICSKIVMLKSVRVLEHKCSMAIATALLIVLVSKSYAAHQT